MAVAAFACGGTSRQGASGTAVGSTQDPGTVASAEPVSPTDSTAVDQSTTDPDGYSPMERGLHDKYSHLPPLEAASALIDGFYAPHAGRPEPSSPARIRFRPPAFYRELSARFLAQALKTDPRSVEALYLRSELHVNNRETAKAVADLDQVLAIDPTYAIAYGRRGLIRLVHDVPGAIADMEKAIELGHDHAYMHAWLSRAYDRQGRSADAVEQYRVILDMKDVDPFWTKYAEKYAARHLDSQ